MTSLFLDLRPRVMRAVAFPNQKGHQPPPYHLAVPVPLLCASFSPHLITVFLRLVHMLVLKCSPVLYYSQYY